MNLWSKGWLIELNVKARGYLGTQLKTNVGLSPQIIKGCIMNKPWYKVSFQAFFFTKKIFDFYYTINTSVSYLRQSIPKANCPWLSTGLRLLRH